MKPATAIKPAPKPKVNPHLVQTSTLHRLMVDKATVIITCQFGKRYTGTIAGFDVFTVKLDNGVLLFTHAIESVCEKQEKDTHAE